MKNPQSPKNSPRAAFTLIEVLVVIAIIGILAGLVTATAVSVVNKGKIKRVQTELARLNTVIESYKSKKGFYPPDNPLSSLQITEPWCGLTNALYYELCGMTYYPSINTYSNLDLNDLQSVTSNTLGTFCGVSGIANSSTGASTDDAAGAENFMKTVAARQVQVTNGVELLIVPFGNQNNDAFNPWHYNSSHPKYNNGSYDLWAVVKIGGRTNIICNWNDSPIVSTNLY